MLLRDRRTADTLTRNQLTEPEQSNKTAAQKAMNLLISLFGYIAKSIEN